MDSWLPVTRCCLGAITGIGPRSVGGTGVEGDSRKGEGRLSLNGDVGGNGDAGVWNSELA